MSTSSKSKTKRGTMFGATGSGYKACKTSFANKIQSFKTLMNQTTGTGKFGRPSPSTLKSFANWINKGAVVQTCSFAQVSRWAKNAKKNFNSRNVSTTACKNVLCTKFGKTTIKAVARTKTGSFIVATSPTCKGKRFSFPK